MEILELITSREAGLTFRQISEELHVPRSSLHGLLTTMVEAGWIDYDPVTRAFWLGIRTLEVGNAYLRALDVPERARPYMERIRDTIDETVQLSVLDGRFNVYVGKVDGRQALALASAVGRRLPAHATGVGKVLLAGLSQEELDRVIGSADLERYTAHTLVDKDELYRHLDLIRRRGYGTDEEEYTVGVRCVAVPLRAHNGSVTAAMSVSVPAIRFDEKRKQQALTLLTQAASEISVALGYRARSVV